MNLNKKQGSKLHNNLEISLPDLEELKQAIQIRQRKKERFNLKRKFKQKIYYKNKKKKKVLQITQLEI